MFLHLSFCPQRGANSKLFPGVSVWPHVPLMLSLSGRGVLVRTGDLCQEGCLCQERLLHIVDEMVVHLLLECILVCYVFVIFPKQPDILCSFQKNLPTIWKFVREKFIFSSLVKLVISFSRVGEG